MGSDHPPALPAAAGDGTTARRRAGRYARIRREVTALSAHRNELLLAIASAALDVLAYVTAEEFDPAPASLGPGIALAILGSAFLPFRRRHPPAVLAAVTVVQLLFTLFTDASAHSYGCALMIAVYTVARYRRPLDIGLAAAAAMTVQVVRAARGTEAFAATVAGTLGATCLVIAVGVGTAAWQQQLAINRKLLADRAVTEERRRIARELHDIVAHHITTMYLMSGGARATLDRDPETAKGALFTLEQSGRTALGEMRQLLGVLRSTDAPEEAPSEPQPGMREIDRLIVESRAAGLPIDYEEIGERRPLSPATGLTLYRVIQEALTNTRKHSGDARACVRVRHLPDRVVVEVVDDGAGGRSSSAGITGSGYGLMGMRERVTLHGGTLEAGRRPEGGFRVVADVPVPGNEREWVG
ncbi:sensor histidine kinase [Embleya sp. NPDC127516]|uniref:sensor histidine kinase n=1 Tax=Embleya sp. NPDC127516 TaxID=3363990 RepID=UPI0037F62FD8